MSWHKKHSRGTVLVTVILMVAVAALIATDIAYRQKMDVLRTAAFLSRDAGFQFLVSAENLGLYALKRDQKEDQRKINTHPDREMRDDKSEEWNKGAAFPLPNGIGTIEGRVFDLQGRFNINSLMSDPQNRPSYRAAFLQLLNTLQSENPNMFPDDVTPAMLQQRLIDWLDEDSDSTVPDGRDDDDYLKLQRPYRSANHFITDISELQLIEGFTPKVLRILEDYVSFLPPAATINLYTADTQVLTAFGLDQVKVREFVNQQRPTKFKELHKVFYSTKAELLTFLKSGTPTGTSAGNNIDNLFDIKSEYYLLKGKALVNGKPVLIESVMWRPPAPNPGTAPPPGPPKPTKVILRKLVDPLKQV